MSDKYLFAFALVQLAVLTVMVYQINSRLDKLEAKVKVLFKKAGLLYERTYWEEYEEDTHG